MISARRVVISAPWGCVTKLQVRARRYAEISAPSTPRLRVGLRLVNSYLPIALQSIAALSFERFDRLGETRLDAGSFVGVPNILGGCLVNFLDRYLKRRSAGFDIACFDCDSDLFHQATDDRLRRTVAQTVNLVLT